MALVTHADALCVMSGVKLKVSKIYDIAVHNKGKMLTKTSLPSNYLYIGYSAVKAHHP